MFNSSNFYKSVTEINQASGIYKYPQSKMLPQRILVLSKIIEDRKLQKGNVGSEDIEALKLHLENAKEEFAGLFVKQVRYPQEEQRNNLYWQSDLEQELKYSRERLELNEKKKLEVQAILNQMLNWGSEVELTELEREGRLGSLQLWRRDYFTHPGELALKFGFSGRRLLERSRSTNSGGSSRELTFWERSEQVLANELNSQFIIRNLQVNERQIYRTINLEDKNSLQRNEKSYLSFLENMLRNVDEEEERLTMELQVGELIESVLISESNPREE